MKTMFVVVLLGSLVPLHAQQQWCFSKDCLQTPATIFHLNPNDKQLSDIFRPPAALPMYKPVAPLPLSPSVRQFFLSSAPNTNLMNPSTALSGTNAVTAKTHGTVRSAPEGHGIATMHGSNAGREGFSTGQGGIRFSPLGPRQ